MDQLGEVVNGQYSEKRIKRRSLLKLFGIGAVSTALSTVLPNGNAIARELVPEDEDNKIKPEVPGNIESETKIIVPQILMIDTTLGKLDPRMIEQNKHKPVDYWAEIASGSGSGEAFLRQKGAWYPLMRTFGEHGTKVFEAIDMIWKKAGIDSETKVEPIDQIVDEKKTKRTIDELKNSVVTVELSGDKLAGLVGKHKDMKIVNLSLLLGQIELKQVNTRIKVESGPSTVFENGKHYLLKQDGTRDEMGMTEEELDLYTKQKFGKKVQLKSPALEVGTGGKDAMPERQRQMRELCTKFPDKLFVFASGNWGEEWDGFKDRPNNCLVVGWESDSGRDAKGADVYVKYSGYYAQSSMGVGMVSALVQIADSETRMSAQELKQWVIEKTWEGSDDLTGEKFKVLNVESVLEEMVGENKNVNKDEKPYVVDPNANADDGLIPIISPTDK